VVIQCEEGAYPGVAITVRPVPNQAWCSVDFVLSLAQAQRMQQDLQDAIGRFKALSPEVN